MPSGGAQKVFHINVQRKATTRFAHGGSAAPDEVRLSGGEYLMVISADARYVYLDNREGEATAVDALCVWHAQAGSAADLGDYARSVGPSSADSCWSSSRLWLMIDPLDETLRTRALARRERFLEDHLIKPDDIGLAMLALLEVANTYRDAQDWEGAARTVEQMDDLLRRADDSR